MSIPEIPPAPKSAQVDVLHGVPVADPFRPLERADDPVVLAWIQAQAARTETVLSQLPLRDATEARLRDLWVYPRRGLPTQRGRYAFQWHYDGIQPHGICWVSENGGDARLLLDPNGWSADGTTAVGAFEPSPDGKYVAYITHVAGSDWGTLHVLDVATASDLPDRIERVRWGDIAWLPDGSAFNYAFPSPEVENHEWIRLHVLGQPPERDETVFRSPLAPPTFAGTSRFLNDQGAVLKASDGTDNRQAVWLLEPDGRTLTAVIDVRIAQLNLIHRDGRMLYALTNHGAPRSRLVAIDIDGPAPDHWVTIVPEGATVLEQAVLAGGRWVLNYSEHGWNRLETRAFDGSDPRPVDLPWPGTGWVQEPHPGDAEVLIQYGTLATPPNQYAIDAASGSARLMRTSAAKETLAGYPITQVFVTARDGARIPLTLIHPPDLKRDGSTPTWMYSYGGFSSLSTHGFSQTVNQWVRAGGVYAIASIRGGSEEGEDWHTAAIKGRRQTAFNDFQDCAEWLIREGYCSSRTLGISGGSNGGLLVAVAMLQRPDLFGAVISEVGVHDMLRFHKFTVGAGWIPDYGSPENAEDFAHLLAYSPVHTVKSDVAYPPILIATSDHDDRVVPMHSYKFAAALQETPSPVVLLRVETNAGHGAGASTRPVQRRAADYLAFMWSALTGRFRRR